MSHKHIGTLVLRLAMAGVYLYFGFSQLFDSVAWTGLVPMWASDMMHVPPAMIVLGNGAFEVVAGALLAAGFWAGPVAVLLAIHLFFIATTFGFSPVGVRDFGLSLATLSLFFLSKEE
jgi:uncharacterized membrane protein YphA (DoxX/SURF4 family)